MYRLVRFALIVGPLSLAFLLLSPSAEASECAFFLLDEPLPEQGILTQTMACRLETESQIETFASPADFEDTLFGRRTYARLAGNANVYPQPSRDAAPVRNATVFCLRLSIRGTK